MATLPGLPMFGHGQIEGFTEKYGMEYYRPRYDETPDRWLIERHDREIAPLLKRRWLFAESYNFLLYDLFHDSGSVDENVFAYSNRVNDQRALIVYNNVYGSTQGTVRMSAAYADKGSGQLRQRSLWEGLGLQDGGSIVAFRDSLTNLEYLRRAGEIGERGMRLELHAYQCYVFLDWRELHATSEKPWDKLCNQLAGRGVPSLDDALINLELRPVHDALRAALDPAVVRLLAGLAELPQAPGATTNRKSGREQSAFFERAWSAFADLLAAAVPAYTRSTGSRIGFDAVHAGSIAPVFRKAIRGATRLPATEALFSSKWSSAARRMLPNANPRLPSTALWGPVLAWCLLQVLTEAIDSEHPEQAALDLFDRLRLREPLAQAFQALGLGGEDGWRVAARIKVLLLVQADAGAEVESVAAPQKPAADLLKSTEQPQLTLAAEALVAEGVSAEPQPAKPISKDTAGTIPERARDLLIPPDLWSDPDLCWLTGAHVAEDHTYVVRESFEELLWWLQLPELLRLAAAPVARKSDAAVMTQKIEKAIVTLDSAGYRVDTLLEPDIEVEVTLELESDEEWPSEPQLDREAIETVPKTGPIPELDPEELSPQEPVIAKPVGPVNPEGPPEEY